jgi:hypothetical protein
MGMLMLYAHARVSGIRNADCFYVRGSRGKNYLWHRRLHCENGNFAILRARTMQYVMMTGATQEQGLYNGDQLIFRL